MKHVLIQKEVFTSGGELRDRNMFILNLRLEPSHNEVSKGLKIEIKLQNRAASSSNFIFCGSCISIKIFRH